MSRRGDESDVKRCRGGTLSRRHLFGELTPAFRFVLRSSVRSGFRLPSQAPLPAECVERVRNADTVAIGGVTAAIVHLLCVQRDGVVQELVALAVVFPQTFVFEPVFRQRFQPTLVGC
eukprot:3760329-Pyramimonas_sp.AAC.1